MKQFLGVLILAAVVILLGHPAVKVPSNAIGPLLAMILPIVSFYVTSAPSEPQLCRARCSNDQKCKR
jgi:hypothetical protein